jgi:hypothetical protein
MAKDKPIKATAGTVLKGAATGAALGSFVPGVGTLVGAGLGALGGLGVGIADTLVGSGVKYTADPKVELLKQAAKSRAQQEAENRLLVQSGLNKELEAAEKAVQTTKRSGRVAVQQGIEEGAFARQKVRGIRSGMTGATAAFAGSVAARSARARRDIRAATDRAIADAEAKLATAEQEVGVKKQEMLKAEAAAAKAQADALAEAKIIFQDAIDNTIFIFDADDRKAAAKEIRETVLPGADQATIDAVEAFIEDTVLSSSHDASWRIG